MQNVVQQPPVDLDPIKQLFNPREIFVPANAGDNGNDVLRTLSPARETRALPRIFAQKRTPTLRGATGR
jgi:hypothetical protein